MATLTGASGPARAASCTLFAHSTGPHIQQLYTGLAMLAHDARIRLTQELVRAPEPRPQLPRFLRDASATHARVVLDGRLRLHYDLHDAQDIDADDLDRCDAYFKRSFVAPYVQRLRGAEKVFPYGLNYHVLPDVADRNAAARSWRLVRSPGRTYALREALDAGNRLGFYPRARELESLPAPEVTPRVLFMTTAYDPRIHGDSSAEKFAECERNNEMRARCIRTLRRELGPRFLGGFDHNAYTLSRYPDCLVEEAEATRKLNYIRTQKAFMIGVATTGMHGSTGWKFAEYIAGAKAIVAERLLCVVPGGLQAGRHYLEFTTPEQCVEQALRLLEDNDLRREMMFDNREYYRVSLRPDALVLDTFRRARAEPRLARGIA